ncbi:predicted protein [Botrytis cinerea T4]|uniref:Uncharacterized protein n=1 Tax=Botryotinia fuckeliana (strain T4) TaxID=999810 RepID=G2YXK5_BOTF4|nr:predicted protein [Botrytis cinerea T4]
MSVNYILILTGTTNTILDSTYCCVPQQSGRHTPATLQVSAITENSHRCNEQPPQGGYNDGRN